MTRSVKCPHCGERVSIKVTKPMTKTYRTAYGQCSNVLCGATYEIITEIIRQISPSAMPDPTVNLPVHPKDQNKHTQETTA